MNGCDGFPGKNMCLHDSLNLIAWHIVAMLLNIQVQLQLLSPMSHRGSLEEPEFSCPDRLGFSVPKSTEATINANAPNSCDKLYKKRVKNIVEMTLSSTKNQCYNDI